MTKVVLKLISKRVASLTALAWIAVSGFAPGLAQVPNFDNLAPPATPFNNNFPPPGNFDAYLLGGGDRLTIDIFEVPQYSGIYQVPADGVIQLPLIGGVRVEGLTIQEASQLISANYDRFLKRPLVTIRLLSARPINVSVSGEVTRPGSFTVSLIGGAGDNPGVQYPTLAQALKQAGGITLAADLTQVQVRRKVSPNSDRTFTVNLEDFVQSGRGSQELTLRDGDSIFVPTATQVSLREVRRLATVDFAADLERARTVAVVGEVQRPGAYTLAGVATAASTNQLAGITGGLPTVTSAIEQAGGIKPLADVRNIQIRRQTQIGTEQVIDVNLWQLLQAGDINQDTVVQNGDTIVIPRARNISAAESAEIASARFSPETIQVSVVGEVRSPGVINIPPNTPLNQALLTAGGFDQARADEEDVRLIRLNEDGTVITKEVNFSITEGVNERSNPILQDNDIIVIGRSDGARFADRLNTVLGPTAAGLALFSIPSRIVDVLRILGIVNSN
ncbi:MAG: SLBB domain-containing protein [Oscillatoria sp. PMC 1051.18]|nr:SLBB domain-containing protein [Oscillatoria sp. PMC 1050.18]MEC5029514.1 SLBB domain-containing protein [Oscillatoria sp. PMC 1051.18]